MNARNPSLVPKQIVDASGKRTTVWVTPTPSPGNSQHRLAQRALPPQGAVQYDEQRPYETGWTPLAFAIADNAHSAVATAEKQTSALISWFLKIFGIRTPAAAARPQGAKK